MCLRLAAALRLRFFFHCRIDRRHPRLPPWLKSGQSHFSVGVAAAGDPGHDCAAVQQPRLTRRAHTVAAVAGHAIVCRDSDAKPRAGAEPDRHTVFAGSAARRLAEPARPDSGRRRHRSGDRRRAAVVESDPRSARAGQKYTAAAFCLHRRTGLFFQFPHRYLGHRDRCVFAPAAVAAIDWLRAGRDPFQLFSAHAGLGAAD